MKWTWQRSDWPELTYSAAAVSAELARAYREHGIVEGKAHAIGLDRASDVSLNALTDEVVATAAIEGEQLSPATVRSSVMRRVGLQSAGRLDRYVDGLVNVITDATFNSRKPLDDDRLWAWQAALFPGGHSGLQRITVGRYRDHADPMQIVSGAPDKEVVHYVAPASKNVPREMRQFLAWFNATSPDGPGRAVSGPASDCLARAAIAHLWFETIHPFEDGNGRIGRAISEMAVAQHFETNVFLYSLSRQLLANRKDYYDQLNRGQRGDKDVTEWVRWFVGRCADAYAAAGKVIDEALEKQRFWQNHLGTPFNERQRKVLQRLLDAGDGGFDGGLNAEKYIKMTGASKATATRDLAEMVRGGQLWRLGEGKAVRYYLSHAGWRHGVRLPGEPREAASA